MLRRRLSCVVALAVLTAPPLSAQRAPARLRVQIDEAQAALELLDTLAVHREPSANLWAALTSSEGYRRLQRREAAMGVPFTDSSFAAFLRVDSIVARRGRLRTALHDWQRMNATRSARQALRWLPAGAKINATVYLLIKPRVNSFVFEASTDPAIMLYLDPDQSVAQSTNTVVHELHHIGFNAVCVSSPTDGDGARGQAIKWLGAFSEGMAMLAAANGPSVHPHANSPAEDRARWDRDVANFDADLHAVEAFVRRVLDERIVGDSIVAEARTFYGVQGPWYTVGWKMAAVITEVSGRNALLSAMCNPADLLRAYNAAAPKYRRRTGKSLATWDGALLARLSAQ